MGKDNRPPKHLRTLKRGDVREDGMIFYGYSATMSNGERWVSPEQLDSYREYFKDRASSYRIENPDRIYETRQKRKSAVAKQVRERRKMDMNFRLKGSLQSRLRSALKGAVKAASTVELLGCSTETLRLHLESQFTDGMSWENYGKTGWHIDHIKPCAFFDLTIDEQQRECFHYTNLQPLWAEDNLKKSDNYE